MLHDFPFCNELNIAKISKAFRGYATTYDIEIIDSKNWLVQSTRSYLSTKGLFKDLLDEMKGFKYKKIQKVLLSKNKEYRDRDFTTVYSNFTNKE